jgi:hypothetical protein
MTDADKMIGDRWQEILNRIDGVLVVRSELNDNERNFLDTLHNNLLYYKSTTFVSAKQLNWLSQIEEHYHERPRR